METYQPLYEQRSERGFFGIGIDNPKYEPNVGTLMRSAQIFNAAFTFTIGERYKRPRTDTSKSTHHTPTWNFPNFKDFYERRPNNCTLVGVELDDRAIDIDRFNWDNSVRPVFIMGAEDAGLSADARKMCQYIIKIPSPKAFSMNVAAAGTIVMYEYTRFLEQRRRRWELDRSLSNRVKVVAI